MTAGRRKVAVITGAGSGIGRSIAEVFGDAGMDVVLSGRNLDTLNGTAERIDGSGSRITVVRADVTVPDDMEALAETVREMYGSADIAIANSGIAGPTGPLWEMELDGWNETLETNVTGVFLFLRALLPDMIEADKEGNVIVIGSVTGKKPMRGRTPYAASKMALIGLVRTLAFEAGESNIRVNLVSPGPTAGDRLSRVMNLQGKARGKSLGDTEAELVADLPLKRLVRATDIARCALFLASTDSQAITGQEIEVNSGWFMG